VDDLEGNSGEAFAKTPHFGAEREGERRTKGEGGWLGTTICHQHSKRATVTQTHADQLEGKKKQVLHLRSYDKKDGQTKSQGGEREKTRRIGVEWKLEGNN